MQKTRNRRASFIGVVVIAVGVTVGCARLADTTTLASVPALPAVNVDVAVAAYAAMRCATCTESAMPTELRSALESRISALFSRGGACQAYARVLETSLANRRIEVRPYMWRVGRDLASAQALPDGDIVVARDIDSLNVGIRTVKDMVRSVEHEAAHIAFAVPTGAGTREAAVDDPVDGCRANSP